MILASWTMSQPTSEYSFWLECLMMRQTQQPGASQIWSVHLISWREISIGTTQRSGSGSRKEYLYAWFSIRCGASIRVFRSSEKPPNNANDFLHLVISILLATYQSEFCEYIPVIVVRHIFLNNIRPDMCVFNGGMRPSDGSQPFNIVDSPRVLDLLL